MEAECVGVHRECYLLLIDYNTVQYSVYPQVQDVGSARFVNLVAFKIFSAGGIRVVEEWHDVPDWRVICTSFGTVLWILIKLSG